MVSYEECELCGQWAYLERHHVFGAANRKHSERWGLVARLCPACHRTGRKSVHQCRETADKVKAHYQRKFMHKYPGESFVAIFGRNYLD